MGDIVLLSILQCSINNATHYTPMLGSSKHIWLHLSFLITDRVFHFIVNRVLSLFSFVGYQYSYFFLLRRCGLFTIVHGEWPKMCQCVINNIHHLTWGTLLGDILFIRYYNWLGSIVCSQ